MSDNSNEEFFNARNTYAKVVKNNYMHHNELAEQIRAILVNRFSDQPLTFLDIGCGDCSSVETVLDSIKLSSYVGVDLSETALRLADASLNKRPFAVAFMHTDMLSALRTSSLFDVIFSSFAIHHLTTNEKTELFRLVSQRLRPFGLFLFVDVVRKETGL